MELVIIACGVVFGLIIGYMLWKNKKKKVVTKTTGVHGGRNTIAKEQ